MEPRQKRKLRVGVAKNGPIFLWNQFSIKVSFCSCAWSKRAIAVCPIASRAVDKDVWLVLLTCKIITRHSEIVVAREGDAYVKGRQEIYHS